MDRHRMPGGGTFTKGTYHFTFGNPSTGTWSLAVNNESAALETDRKLVSTEDAEYSLTVRALDASITPDTTQEANVVVANQDGQITEPVVKESWGKLTSYQASFARNGLGNSFDINVAPDSSALIVNARVTLKSPSQPVSNRGLDLYLYDCTSGECFLFDFALPASDRQQIVVRTPQAGRWVAVLGSPSFPSIGSFAVDAVVLSDKESKTFALKGPIVPGEQRTISSDVDGVKPFPEAVRVYELFDEAIERASTEHPWGRKVDLDRLQNRAAALAITVKK
jgi:hypothetical protein